VRNAKKKLEDDLQYFKEYIQGLHEDRVYEKSIQDLERRLRELQKERIQRELAAEREIEFRNRIQGLEDRIRELRKQRLQTLEDCLQKLISPTRRQSR